VEEAVWVEKKSSLSPIWIVPIIALLVGAWLVYKAFDEKGLTIKIVFPSATGIVAEKTSIKYKNIEIGKVINVNFTKDLKSVVVTAELKKNMRPYLSEKSRFWIMSARVGLNSVEGLDTLLSGAYIVMDPKIGKKSLKSFKGLKNVPIISDETEGKVFKLKANSIGSLDIGSPIYYKRLKAGNIVSYKLANDRKSVDMEIFIKKPYSNLIDTKTRFWNASGIDASIGADGVRIHTESMASILTGGLSFNNFTKFGKGEDVDNNYLFTLYN
jgi:paraquat-inducible protein B